MLINLTEQLNKKPVRSQDMSKNSSKSAVHVSELQNKSARKLKKNVKGLSMPCGACGDSCYCFLSWY